MRIKIRYIKAALSVDGYKLCIDFINIDKESYFISKNTKENQVTVALTNSQVKSLKRQLEKINV